MSYWLILHRFKSSPTTSESVPRNTFSWIEPVSTLLCLLYYFHCQPTMLSRKMPKSLGFLQSSPFLTVWVPVQVRVLLFNMFPRLVAPHGSLAYISQNFSNILLQPTGLECSLNFLRCQTSRNSIFQNTGLPVSGSKGDLPRQLSSYCDEPHRFIHGHCQQLPTLVSEKGLD